MCRFVALAIAGMLAGSGLAIAEPTSYNATLVVVQWRYACMSRPWIKTVKEKRPERIKDAYERAVRESDGYRTV
jgi:hypothetical protein